MNRGEGHTEMSANSCEDSLKRKGGLSSGDKKDG